MRYKLFKCLLLGLHKHFEEEIRCQKKSRLDVSFRKKENWVLLRITNDFFSQFILIYHPSQFLLYIRIMFLLCRINGNLFYLMDIFIFVNKKLWMMIPFQLFYKIRNDQYLLSGKWDWCLYMHEFFFLNVLLFT